MKRKPLIWHLYPTYLFVVLLTAAAVAGYAAHLVKGSYEARMETDLAARTGAATARLAPLLDTGGNADAACREISALTLCRVTLILPDGRVTGDSSTPSGLMENHANRPEVAAAISGRDATARRYSATIKSDLIYAAHPVMKDGRVKGVVRLAVSVATVDRPASVLAGRMASAGLLIALFAALVSLLAAVMVTRPLRKIRDGAERMGAGDTNFRLDPPSSKELALLAETLNRTADEVTSRIREVTRQRNELDAVLTSMAEGVIAVDRNGAIMRVNRAAARILGRPSGDYPGLAVSSVLRNRNFEEFLARALKSEAPLEETIQLAATGQTLLLRSAALSDPDGAAQGILVVMLDVTQLKALERVRQDFAANASHEIRTPLAAIKGAVETLLHGGGLSDPATARRFLEMAEKHAERLTALVADLLTISRLDHAKTAADGPEKKPVPVQRVLLTAADSCAEKARAGRMTVNIDCPDDLTAPMDEVLMEQAVANLLDNAVKYAAPGTEISLEAGLSEGFVEIRVKDLGPGMAKEHLDRIFERFYRVDKGRDRSAGGTGLGLAIVKHIALVHGGSVRAESSLGLGSRFTIRIPA
ncbi:MAG: PAS domain-containing protein [Deltaproteobacteria bacterium]|nr:PAS domain-containing protein [Deltaproteobacteria bacterium]